MGYLRKDADLALGRELYEKLTASGRVYKLRDAAEMCDNFTEDEMNSIKWYVLKSDVPDKGMVDCCTLGIAFKYLPASGQNVPRS